MENVSYSFRKLRPLCVNLTRCCTVSNIQELKYALMELDSSSLQQLQEYVVFPLRIILRKENGNDIIIECVKCMKCIIENTIVSTWSVFSDVFLQLHQLITSRNSVHKVNQISEELKITVVECIEMLISHASEDVLLQMFSQSFCPPVGHALFVWLELLKQEKSKSLQVSILKTIGALTYFFVNPKCSRIEKVRRAAGDSLASFLPGISVTLQHVICGDWKQGHTVIVNALHVWREFITTTIGDCYISMQEKERSVNEPNKEYVFPIVVRNDMWVNETANKLQIVVKNISSLVYHNHWKVRFALLEWARSILCDCKKTLKNCIPTALEVLFALSVDSYEQITLKSKETIKQFLILLKAEDLTSLLTLLEEDLYMLMSNLVKCIHTAHDSQKLVTLKTMHGYIQFLGFSLDNLLYSPPHLERFIRCFVHLLEFDCSGICFFEERELPSEFAAEKSSVQNNWPKKSFKYFQDREIELTICSIFQLLGFYGDIRVLIDYLLEQFIEATDKRKQSIFLITNVIRGTNANCINQQFFIENRNAYKLEHLKMTYNIQELIRDVLEEFLSSNHWKLQVSSTYETRIFQHGEVDNTDFIECDTSVGTYNDYVHQICLLLESISSFAEVLGPNFVPFLIHVLCPVMEKAGSSCLLISHTAQVALNNISYFCGFNSVQMLILENADYLVNTLSISFNHYSHNPEAPLVLKVALQICNVDLLPLIKDSILKILNILDYNQEKALPLMNVLYAFVIAIQKWYPFKKQDGSLCKYHDLEGKTFKSIFLDHHDLKQKERNLPEENLSELVLVDEKCNLENIEDKSIESPLHVQMITWILQRCVHLQSFKKRNLCLLALDIIAESVVALKNFQDQLLPLIHNIWNPFLLRFSGELVITMKAFDTLLVIANECGEFIKTRTVSDILPKLLVFLNNQREISLGKGNSSYKFMNAYRFQLNLLSELGRLCKMLDVQEKELEMVASCCLLYLNAKQPLLLQEAALKSLNFLASIDKDAVWLYFSDTYSCSKKIYPPHQNLCIINLASTSIKSHSYVNIFQSSLN